MIDISEQLEDFKSFEIVLHDENNTLKKLICELKSIEADKIIIHVDNKKNNNLMANVGDDLQVNIYTDYGVFSSNSKVLKLDKMTTYTEYEIAYPSSCKHAQRREYFRADLNIKFSLELLLNNDETNPQTQIINGVTKDICGRGICYLANSPFLSYSSMKISLFFPEKTITTRAELVYSEPIIIGNETKFKNAFLLPDIEPRDIDYIVKQCFLYQLKLRKLALERDV